MSLQLTRIDDPRDALSKAKRYELYTFAKKHGLEVTEQMPAILIRQKLRDAGKTNIVIPVRTLGKVEFKDEVPASGGAENLVDAEADLARQYEQQPKTTGKSFGEMSRAQLAKTCKERGVKFKNTDKKEALVEKLIGQNAA